MDKLFEKLKEPSTWRGIFILIGLFGVYIAPEKIEEVSVSIGTLIGLIEIYRNEA